MVNKVVYIINSFRQNFVIVIMITGIYS